MTTTNTVRAYHEALLARGELRGLLADFENTIEAAGRAEALLPAGHPERAAYKATRERAEAARDKTVGLLVAANERAMAALVGVAPKVETAPAPKAPKAPKVEKAPQPKPTVSDLVRATPARRLTLAKRLFA